MRLILDALDREKVLSEPYPHFHVPEALDPEDYERLLGGLPTIEAMKAANPNYTTASKMLTMNEGQMRASDAVGQGLKDFLDLHLSEQYVSQLLDVYEHHIKDYYPKFFSRGLNKTLSQSASLTITNPDWAHRESTNRYAHIDNSKVFSVLLLYLRHPEDDSTGGEFQISRHQGRFRGFNLSPKLDDGRELDDSSIELVRDFPYQGNSAVCFMNSINSVHGVGLRSASLYPRWALNINVHAPEALFDPFQEAGVGFRIRRKAHNVMARLWG